MEFYTVLKAFSLERKNSKKLESRILFPNIFLGIGVRISTYEL